MNLNISDPALLFPGISLLFLAYTNRYLAIANIIRELNKVIAEHFDENRERQIQGLLVRIQLIRYMQLFGLLAFICCTISIGALLLNWDLIGRLSFGASILFLFISLCSSFLEVAKSGDGLRIEIERTHPNIKKKNTTKKAETAKD